MLVELFVESRPAAQIGQFGILVELFVELNYFTWTPQSPTPFPIMALNPTQTRTLIMNLVRIIQAWTYHFALDALP